MSSAAIISVHRTGEKPHSARLRDLDYIEPHEIAQRPDHQEIFEYLCGSPLWGWDWQTDRWVRWKKP